ncbi:MAG: ATP-binding cassette domain-containing protein [Oscillospiraceae bacterium]|nr:ATP-binding cassette domain-containing protein [Oscillospiraceae bacterium]
MAHIAVKDLSFTYPNSTKKALDNINMEIEPGQFILVCGASGCSKTTLLRHFKSVLTPHGKREGRIIFNNKELSEIPEKEQAEKIGFVFQSPEDQIVTDKVWHELAFSLESLNKPNDVIALRSAETAGYFDLGDKYRSDVNTLSGGQKQLLNLASVMTVTPEVLILDEPTSQLDPIASDNFLSQIKKLNDDLGITIIISEHNLERVFSMADKVAVMKDGKLLSFDTPENTAKSFGNKTSDFFLSLPSSAQIAVMASFDGKTPLTVKEGRQALIANGITDKKTDLISSNEIKNKESKKERVLEIDDVFFRYNRYSPDVLRNLSLDVNRGEILCVTGGNGEGKSTLFSILSGMTSPYSGKIKAGKKSMKPSDLRNKTSLLPQDVSVLFVKDSVIDELKEVKKKNGETPSDEEINKTAELFEIDNLLKSHPFDLSGGEQEKLAIAKILLTEAEIYLFDEPTNGMDPTFKLKFGEIIRELKKSGKTFIIVSHDIEFSAAFADRCVMIFDGRVVSDSEPREFFSGNSFYTTTANKIVRSVFPDCILTKEAWEKCREQTEK